MTKYVNSSGQEPTLDEDPNSPDPLSPERRRRSFNRYAEQAGHLPIDRSRCQAPTVNLGPRIKERCPNDGQEGRPAPVCVMVENQPNSHGKIAGMALCQFCADRAKLSHGPDYATFTPI